MCLAITIKCYVKVVDSRIRIGDPVASDCKLGTPGFHSRSEEINWPIFIVQIASFILLVLSNFWQMTGLLLRDMDVRQVLMSTSEWGAPVCMLLRPGFPRIVVGAPCNRFIVAEPCRMLSTNLMSLVGEDHQTLRGNRLRFCDGILLLFNPWLYHTCFSCRFD